MTVSRPLLSVVVLVAALVSADRQHFLLNDRPPTTHSEQLRLRSHFDSVDLELRRAETSALSDTQRAARRQVIAWLKDYREAGLFPRNERFADAAVPFFRDSRGTLCAMAYLVARSGRQDIVDDIARTRNNAFIHELADDRELVRWVDSVGLTLGEAARIQPTYQRTEDESVNIDYALASLIVSGAALSTAGLNTFAPSRTSGWFGVLTGAAAAVTGLGGLAFLTNTTNSRNAAATLAGANVLVGATAMGLGIRGLVVARHKASPASAGALQRAAAALVVTPAAVPGRRGPALALSFRGRF
jgi:hypothetical protein